MDRNLWLTLDATEQMLGDVAARAKACKEWGVYTAAQNARTRFHPYIVGGRLERSDELLGQLSLIDSRAGRRHDTEPAA